MDSSDQNPDLLQDPFMKEAISASKRPVIFIDPNKFDAHILQKADNDYLKAIKATIAPELSLSSIDDYSTLDTMEKKIREPGWTGLTLMPIRSDRSLPARTPLSAMAIFRVTLTQIKNSQPMNIWALLRAHL